jgi:GntR family transcriptional repressor for pyruvate dehydrogenase complex
MSTPTANTRRLTTGSYAHLVTSDDSDAHKESGQNSVVDLTQKLLAFFAQSDVIPGQRLASERQLAEQMGVGRSVIREALKLLTVLGFLEVRHGDGTYLTNKTSNLLPRIVEWGLFLGDHSIDALIEARSTLEVALAGMSASVASEAEKSKISKIFADMQSAAQEGNLERYANADIAFHLAIAKASGNPVLEGVIINIRSLMQTWTDKVLHHVDLTESLALHLPILDAIIAGDPVAARTAMQHHMDEAIENLRKTTASMSDTP